MGAAHGVGLHIRPVQVDIFFMCTDIGLGEVSAGTAMAGIMRLPAIPLASCATLCPLCIAPTNYKTPHRRLSARHHCSSRCLAIW